MEEKELAMRIAIFRFGVISDFVTGGRLPRGERERLLRSKCAREWKIPGSTRTSISRATLLLWVDKYKKAGKQLAGLCPQRRSDRGQYRKLDATLRIALRDLKRENPNYTLPVMLTKLKHARILKTSDELNRSLLYRFLKHECPEEKGETAADRRRFEAEYPNEIWQCDVMHGPQVKMPEGPQRKSYLVAIIDDHSRLIVHAEFYTQETLEILKDCLKKALEKRGLPQKFYVDNGACYRATNLEQVLASLGVALTHSRPYTPQGRGKIERWFGYVRQDFIPLYAERPLPLLELNERLESWVDRYNGQVHSTTKMTPYERFKKNLSCVRPAPAELTRYFRLVEFRVVKRDRTVHLGGRIYEVPLGLIDKKVELRFHPEAVDKVEVFLDERSYGMAQPLNSTLNARLGREYESEEKKNSAPPRVETAPSEPLSGRLFSQGAHSL